MYDELGYMDTFDNINRSCIKYNIERFFIEFFMNSMDYLSLPYSIKFVGNMRESDILRLIKSEISFLCINAEKEYLISLRMGSIMDNGKVILNGYLNNMISITEFIQDMEPLFRIPKSYIIIGGNINI